jgi:hypothetical protein
MGSHMPSSALARSKLMHKISDSAIFFIQQKI